jgi:hypothetical protein
MVKKVPRGKIISFRATSDFWTRLQAIEKRTGATPSVQVFRAVSLWLKQQEAGR